MCLGRNIKKLRLEENLTQGELAKEAGISKGYLRRIEKGKVKRPHMKTLSRIANSLGTDIEDLMRDGR